ncbi:MAG TPA: DUF4157 domain-containing protein, partial [Actinomycetota bacterium]|nr:DUF4157 domain-containing protein [Actinomycetota bacterium]
MGTTTAQPSRPPALPPAVHETLRSPGRPLDVATAAFMGDRFGADLGGVRVHTDARAAASAAEVDAAAYAVGSHVVFGPGQWAPHEKGGRAVLAHELAHVLQARASPVSHPGLNVGAPDAAAEREATDLAAVVASGGKARPPYLQVAASTLSRLQRGAAPGAAPTAGASDSADSRAAMGENPVVWEARLDQVWGEGGETPDPVAVQSSADFIHAVLHVGLNPNLVVDEMRKRAKDLIHIRRAFDEKQPKDLRTMVIEKLDRRQPLVRILALLYSGRDDETYAQIGLAIIPPLTRDAELARIFGGFDRNNLHAREVMKNAYDQAFAGIHKTAHDTLEEHLSDDVSNPELDKYLILLHRNLTPADELHLATTARSVTDKEVAIGILQTQYFKGVNAFQQLKDDWEVLHVEGFVHGNLKDAMSDELAGEAWQIAQSIFNAFDERMGLVGEFNTAMWEGQEIDQERFTSKRENIDLTMLLQAFIAATVGGRGGGAGTNEEQVYLSFRKIREIYEERIARATTEKNPGLAAERRQAWNSLRAWLTERVEGGAISEMGGYELVQAKLELFGKLTYADQVWLAWQASDEAKMLDLVTDAWVENKELELRHQAEDPPAGSSRPPFHAWTAVAQNNPASWKIAELLREDGSDHVQRGARRLKLDLEGTAGSTASSDLLTAYKFLQKVDRAELLEGVLEAFFDLPGPTWGWSKSDYVASAVTSGREYTHRTMFIGYLLSPGSPFEFSVLMEDVKDLVRGPATSLDELVDRAEMRTAASVTGSWYFDTPLAAAAEAVDWVTGEDTQDVARDALVRLRRMAKEAKANPQDLELMMAMSGSKDVMALGQLEFNLFKDRLEDARNTRTTIVETFGTIIDVAGRSLLVTIIGPVAGAGLVSALGAFMSGMLVREGFLAQDYDLFSTANLSTLLEEVATFGFDSLGFEAVIAETFSAQAVGRLFKLESAGANERIAKIVQETLKSSGSKLFEKAVANAIGGLTLPSGDELASRALNMVMLGSLKSLTSPMVKKLTIFSTNSERMGKNLISTVINGPPAKAALPTVLVKEFMKIVSDPNFAHMTPGDIAARLANAAFSSVASAMSVTAALTHVQQVQARDARRWGAANPDLLSHMIATDPVLGPAYQDYVADNPRSHVAPYKWVQTLQTVKTFEETPTSVKDQEAMSLAPRLGR